MIGGPPACETKLVKPDSALQKMPGPKVGADGTAARWLRGAKAVEGEQQCLDADQEPDPARVDMAEGEPAERDADHGAGQDDAQVGGIGAAAKHHQADGVDGKQNGQHHRGGEGRRHHQCHQRHAEAARRAAEARLGHADQHRGGNRQQPEGEGQGGGVLEHAGRAPLGRLSGT